MKLRQITAVTLLGLTAVTATYAASSTSSGTTTSTNTAAQAAGQEARDFKHHRRGGHHRGAHSMERIALRNVLVEKLSQQTGKPAADVEAALKQPRSKMAAALGMDDEALRSSFKSARETMIDRAVVAQLITSAQAEALKQAPPRHRKGEGAPDGHRAGQS